MAHQNTPFKPTLAPKFSLWGEPTYTSQIAPGIWHVCTPEHGGFVLSDERQNAMPDALRLKDPNYEEDINYALVLIAFDEELREHGNFHKSTETIDEIFARAYHVAATWQKQRIEEHRTATTSITIPDDEGKIDLPGATILTQSAYIAHAKTIAANVLVRPIAPSHAVTICGARRCSRNWTAYYGVGRRGGPINIFPLRAGKNWDLRYSTTRERAITAASKKASAHLAEHARHYGAEVSTKAG